MGASNCRGSAAVAHMAVNIACEKSIFNELPSFCHSGRRPCPHSAKRRLFVLQEERGIETALNYNCTPKKSIVALLAVEKLSLKTY